MPKNMLHARDKNRFKYLFGPVISRRLGVSLGVDIVPPKACPFECVYCEAGATTKKTLVREEFFPLTEVFGELTAFLSSNPRLDFITFSGAGEPTLYSRLGELISRIKKDFPAYGVCLITNGVLIGVGKMPEELAGLDLIMPSLDASDEESFRKINRSIAGITLNDLLDSIMAFRRRNNVRMWLEIFIVPGLNDSEASVAKFAEIIVAIRPDKVQLNGLDRPSAEKWVARAPPESVERFRRAISPVCEVEAIVGRAPSRPVAILDLNVEDAIMSLISRRPCTEQEIAQIFSLDDKDAKRIISELLSSGKLKEEKMANEFFFVRG